MKRYAVIGDPIAHSLSPTMHRAALEASGIEASYEPVHVTRDALADTLAAFWDSGLAGFNVTLPHKQSMFDHCAEIDEVARSVGAINTVWRGESGWCATNTDAEGFVRSLSEVDELVAGSTQAELSERTLEERFPEALVLGAGGAARAVVVGLQAVGVKVTVSARRPGAAEPLRDLGASVRPWGGLDAPFLDAFFLSAPLVVNATSASLHHGEAFAESLPFRSHPFRTHQRQTFVDLVYTPRETPFLRRARELGAQTIDGSGMLLHQGVIAFERWHGVAAPLDVMRRALDAALA